MLQGLGFGPDAVKFYKHPRVVNRTCSHGFGGFKCQGQRLLGVHAFLQQRYYPHFTATRKATGRPVHKKAGQRAGSRADAMITKYITDKWTTPDGGKMRPTGAAANILNFVQNTYSLDILDAHVLVHDEVWGVATEIDLLAQTRTAHATLFVIENKTTLQTRAEHQRTYFMTDRGFPILQGRLKQERNNEYTHHQLQLAVMVSMLRRNYGLSQAIDGAVIMRVKGGSVVRYPLEPRILEALEADMSVPQPIVARVVDRPSTLSVYKPYITPPSTTRHTRWLACLAAEEPIPPDLTLTTQRWRQYLQATYPGAAVHYNVALGGLAVLGHAPQQVRLKVDAQVMTAQGPIVLLVKFLTVASSLKTALQRPNRQTKLLPNGSLHTLKSAYCLEMGARWALCPEARAYVVVMSPTELICLTVPPKFLAPFTQVIPTQRTVQPIGPSTPAPDQTPSRPATPTKPTQPQGGSRSKRALFR